MTAEQVEKQVRLLEDKELPAGVIGVHVQEKEAELLLFFNPNETEETVNIPDGVWDIFVRDEVAGTDSLGVIKDKNAKIAPISALVLVKGLSK